MRSSYSNSKRNSIHFIETSSELGAGTRGASLGVQALKTAALKAQSTLFGQYPFTVVANENHQLHAVNKTNFPYAKHIDSLLRVYEHTNYGLSPLLRKEDCFPIVLAGDHSNAAGTIACLRMANPQARLGVVWIDAHADLHTPYTTPSGNIHGMPLGMALGIDNLDKQRNNPCKQTIAYWEALKNLGNISPKILPQDLAFIALRSTEEEEEYLLEKHNIATYLVDEVRQSGAQTVAQKILMQLQDCDLIYVSFDVDSMDCDIVSHGTGTPVENGLFPEEAQTILNTLLADPRTCCLEITEVNPTLDEKCNKMAETTFSILENLVPTITARGQYDTVLQA